MLPCKIWVFWVKQYAGKIWSLTSCLSRSLTVAGNNMEWLATNYLQLVIHTNHGPVSYHFQDKQQFRLKTQKFASQVFNTLPRVFPLNSVMEFEPYAPLPLPEGEESLSVSKNSTPVIFWHIVIKNAFISIIQYLVHYTRYREYVFSS